MLWADEKASRRHGFEMSESGGLLTLENLPSGILERRVEEIPKQALENLGLQLHNDIRGVAGNWEGVAEVLGISKISELEEIRRRASVKHVFPGSLMLKDWSTRKGSTVYVLLNALRRQNREDCIDLIIKACQDAHCMELLVKIDTGHDLPQFTRVPTTIQATLRDSLENVLTDHSGSPSSLANYEITGPLDHLSWHTPAGTLQGIMLSLKKVEATEESLSRVYEPVRQPVVNLVQSQSNLTATYFRSGSNIGLNIPPDVPQSVSCNFTSTTVPKRIDEEIPMNEVYNNLNSFTNQNDCNSTIGGSDRCLTQTVVKSPDCESQTFFNHSSITQPKGLQDALRSQDCAPNAGRFLPTLPHHYENLPQNHPSVTMNHPVISFSNQSPQHRQQHRSNGTPQTCVQHPIYIPHTNTMTQAPCHLQRRNDGYIEAVHGRVLCPPKGSPMIRQQSDPVPKPCHPKGTDDSVMSRSYPGAGQCVIARDWNGYASFAVGAVSMDVDQDSKPSPSPVRIENDANGYMTFAGATAASSEATQNETSANACNNVSMQHDSDGYLSYKSEPLHQSSKDSNCSDYIPMQRPAQRSRTVSDCVTYASMPVDDDEEQDAEVQEAVITDGTSMEGRYDSASEYSDTILSNYDTISDDTEKEARPLPPRPPPCLPMKRRRLQSQNPALGLSSHSHHVRGLEKVPGWCASETEQSIMNTMKKHKSEDGNFIVWWMESKKRFVITVSHLNELRHYAVYQKHNSDILTQWFVFPGGYEFSSLRELVENYMKEGLKGPDLPAGHKRGKRWQQFSHVKLRTPLRVKYTQSAVRVRKT